MPRWRVRNSGVVTEDLILHSLDKFEHLALTGFGWMTWFVQEPKMIWENAIIIKKVHKGFLDNMIVLTMRMLVCVVRVLQYSLAIEELATEPLHPVLHLHPRQQQ